MGWRINKVLVYPFEGLGKKEKSTCCHPSVFS